MSPRHAPDIPGVELHEVIGTGGSGVVYRGRQLAFDRPVAVKVVPADGSDDATRRRWEREVTAIGRLSNHPNVVPVYDAGTTAEGASYLVMPLVPGGSLGDRLRAEGALDPVEVAAIGVKLAGTLSAVHAAGVLHRDIKPDNVLWSPHGEPQLTDFGIARLQDRTATLTHTLQATVAYAAPEVLTGGEATEATDVYGLGATLYACLTGEAPHPSRPGEHVAAAVARAVEEDPPPLAARGVPVGLARVVERALARDPAQRQADATRLHHELERAAADLHGPVEGDDLTEVLAPTAVVAGVAADAPTRAEAAVAAAPVEAPPERPRPPRTAAGGGPGGGRTLWLGVLAVVVLAAGLLLVAAMGDDDEGGEATATTTSAPVEPAATASTDAATTTTEATTTTTEATTTSEATTTTADPGGASPDGAGDAAVTYLQLLEDDELDEAWSMTTSRFQAQQDRQQWESFWEGHDVEIVGDPVVDAGAGTVVVPIRYDGQREDYRLDVVRQGGGWLIDGPVGD